MIRYLFWLWLLPLTLFWGWYGLSYNDISFGMTFLSRDLHDLVFHIYGTVLGVDPATIPGLFLKACIFDTFLIFGFVAFRKRRQIRQWWQERNARPEEQPAAEIAEPVQLPAE